VFDRYNEIWSYKMSTFVKHPSESCGHFMFRLTFWKLNICVHLPFGLLLVKPRRKKVVFFGRKRSAKTPTKADEASSKLNSTSESGGVSTKWIFARAQDRAKTREEKKRSDWLFDRAQDRKKFHDLMNADWNTRCKKNFLRPEVTTFHKLEHLSLASLSSLVRG
jgi:hypothetical protein